MEKQMNEHPFPYIDELKDIPEIKTFSDIIKIRDFVFSLIPWGPQPFSGNAMEAGVKDLYNGFKKKTIFGWCGLNAEFFRLIICEYHIRCWPFNYGLSNYDLSHVGAVTDLSEKRGLMDLERIPFYMDVYFCKHFTFQGEFPLTFDRLIDLIHKRKTNLITPVYGVCKKPVWDTGSQKFIDRSPEEFEKMIMDFYRDKLDYNQLMEKIFGENDPLLLMLIRIK
jgi:hypothetical protein